MPGQQPSVEASVPLPDLPHEVGAEVEVVGVDDGLEELLVGDLLPTKSFKHVETLEHLLTHVIVVSLVMHYDFVHQWIVVEYHLVKAVEKSDQVGWVGFHQIAHVSIDLLRGVRSILG